MRLVLNDGPAVEIITVAEAKEHLRLDSSTYAGSTEQYQSIAPGSHVVAASYSLKGSGVSVLGKRALVRLSAGACGSGGTVDVKIQEADTDSDGEYADWTGGAFTQVVEDNDNDVFEIEYTGSLAYIRVVSTVAVATCEFAVPVEVQEGVVAEDEYITSAIQAVREIIEQETGRALITQTWKGYFDKFPAGRFFELPLPPLQSVASIKYRDSAGDWSTWDSDEYIVQTSGLFGAVHLSYGLSWPSFTAYPVDPIEVIFTAGYGDARTDVPMRARQAAKLLLSNFHNFREEVITGTMVSRLPPTLMTTVENLLWRLRAKV